MIKCLKKGDQIFIGKKYLNKDKTCLEVITEINKGSFRSKILQKSIILNEQVLRNLLYKREKVIDLEITKENYIKITTNECIKWYDINIDKIIRVKVPLYQSSYYN